MVDSRELTKRIEESSRPGGELAIGQQAEPENPGPAPREPIFGFLNEAYFSEV
jgi:hypothetical protein